MGKGMGGPPGGRKEARKFEVGAGGKTDRKGPQEEKKGPGGGCPLVGAKGGVKGCLQEHG